MNFAQNQTDMATRFWHVSQRAVQELMDLSSEELSRWVELNQQLAKDMAQPDPMRALMAPGQYLSSLLMGAWEGAGKRAEIAANAWGEVTGMVTRNAGEQLEDARHAASDLAESAAKAGRETMAAAGRVAEVVEEALDDDLQQIDGIGEVMSEHLRSAGIHTIGALAMLDVRELENEAHPLHSIAGRIVADRWVEQAQALLRPEHG